MRRHDAERSRVSALRRTLVPAVLVAALALSACTSTVEQSSSAPAGDGTPQAGGTLRTSVVDPGGDLDPVLTASPGGTGVVDSVTEKLAIINDKFEASPVLATEWSATPDNLNWTFKIREGVKFNDGSTLVPADVVATYNRIIGPGSTSPAKGSFAGLLDTVQAQGESVVFSLKKPFADFPVLVAGNNTQILPASYEVGSWKNSYIGTGPFTVKAFKPGQGVTLEKNPSYWNSDKIYLQTVEYKFFKDQQARVLALQSGEVDGLYGEPISSNLTSALDESKLNVTSDPTTGFSAFAFRVDTAPFDDVKVRQAVAWALDRDAISEKLYDGQSIEGNDTVYSSIYPVTPTGLEQRNANADKVKELLADRKIKFTITTSSTEEGHALLIQQQLRKFDNFDVDVQILSSAEYFADGDNAPWLSAPATISYWGSRPVPSQFNDNLYRTGALWNASHYSNPTLDALFDQYDATSGKDERAKIVDQIAEIQWTDVPVVISAFPNTRRYLSKKLHMPYTPGNIDYTNVWIEH
ncbi:peptide/nickel transport system substrate-binding protein [Rhodococcus sp. 27YEA15]|uniref:ABC transporter substrate-binding protein n=1 Tax=Rhodococcus sp. 27YEA15 TaxID=3156259 RepID=UPI003C7D5580